MDRADWCATVYGLAKSAMTGRLIHTFPIVTWREVAQSCPTLCDPMDCTPTRFLCPWKFPSLVAQLVKNPLAVQETWVWSLGWDDPLEKGKATHSSILAWRIPGTVLSMESQRVGHDSDFPIVESSFKKKQPTQVLLKFNMHTNHLQPWLRKFRVGPPFPVSSQVTRVVVLLGWRPHLNRQDLAATMENSMEIPETNWKIGGNVQDPHLRRHTGR